VDQEGSNSGVACKTTALGWCMQGLQRVQKSTKQDQDFARKQFAAALQELERMRDSAHPRPQDAVGFCPDVNRRLMAPIPPRNITVSRLSHPIPALLNIESVCLTCPMQGASSPAAVIKPLFWRMTECLLVLQFLTSQQTWDHYAKLLEHLLLVGDIVKVQTSSNAMIPMCCTFLYCTCFSLLQGDLTLMCELLDEASFTLCAT
jgi:hypothetical protein